MTAISLIAGKAGKRKHEFYLTASN